MQQERESFSMQDVAEITIGSVVLAFPIALSEEVWTLGEQLPLGRTILISLSSILFIGWFGYHMFYRTILKSHWRDFLLRIFSVYVITLVVSAMILFAIDHFPVMTEPVVTFKRMVIIAFPASFSATIVDSLGSRNRY